MNIFAQELSAIAMRRGLTLIELDRVGIHPQQALRLQQSLRRAQRYHLLSQRDLCSVKRALGVTQEEAQRLDAALLASAIGEFLSDRLPWPDVCSATTIIYEILQCGPLSTTAPATFPQGNVFAWVLQEILVTRGLRITQIDDHPCRLHRKTVARLLASFTEDSASSVPLLSPEDLDSVVGAYCLSADDVVRLHAALLATPIYRLLAARADKSIALRRTNELFPVILQALQEDARCHGPLCTSLGLPESTGHPLTPAEPPCIQILSQDWLRSLERRSYARATIATYGAHLTSFGEFLHQQGCHLLSDPVPIARFAVQWASLPASRATLCPTTVYHRLAILSSFYRFVARRYDARFLTAPIPVRDGTHSYRLAHPSHPALDGDAATRTLTWLHCLTGEDYRNYALLWIALTSARPPRELLAMTIGNLQRSQADLDQLLLTWPSTRPHIAPTVTLLPRSVSEILLVHVFDAYMQPLDALAPDLPLWISYSNQNRGCPISPQTLGTIASTYLGTPSIRAFLAAHACSTHPGGLSPEH